MRAAAGSEAYSPLASHRSVPTRLYRSNPTGVETDYVYDIDGNRELRSIGPEDPTAVAVSSDGGEVAIAFNGGVSLLETKTFRELERFPTKELNEVLLFAAGDRAVMAFSRNAMVEKSGGRLVEDAICQPSEPN